MIDRRESRIRAYRYIADQAKKTSQVLSHMPEKTLADINYISLYDLLRLREGLADPSQELVVTLKKLLSGVASEAEIDDYLVRPFLPETPHKPSVEFLTQQAMGAGQ